MINPLGKSLPAGARKSLYRWRQRGPDIDSGAGVVYQFGVKSAMSYDGDTVAIQGKTVAGVWFVRVYKWNQISQKYEQFGSELNFGFGSTGNTGFGDCVSLNDAGTRIAISTRSFENKAFVYDFNGTDWVLTRTFEKVGGSDVTGITELSLSGDGNRLLLAEGILGFAYLWQYDGSQWVSLGIPTANNRRLVGTIIAISRNGLVVGSAGNDIRTVRVDSNGVFSPMGPSNQFGYFETANPIARGFLNEDGTLFATNNPRVFLGGESWDVYRYRGDTIGWSLVPRDAVVTEGRGGIMCATGRLICTYNSAGNFNRTKFEANVYNVVTTPTPGFVKVGQTVPHTGSGAGSYQIDDWDNTNIFHAISGNGTTIGRGQSTSPNSTLSSTQSYTVHRLTIE